jgi:hypothetical protein
MEAGMTDTHLEVLERLVAAIPAAGDIQHPDWTDCFQSWRSYVPNELRANWTQLPHEAQLIAVILGNEIADREHWQ